MACDHTWTPIYIHWPPRVWNCSMCNAFMEWGLSKLFYENGENPRQPTVDERFDFHMRVLKPFERARGLRPEIAQ